MNWKKQAALTSSHPASAFLMAGGMAKMVLGSLEPEERAPFDAFHTAMRGWLPKRRPAELTEIYESRWAPMVAVDAANDGDAHPSSRAMRCAHLQVFTVLPLLRKRVLPPEAFYDMTQEDFIAIGSEVAKVAKTSMAALSHRAAALLAAKGDPFPEQCALADRMLWDVSVRERQAPERVRPALLHLSAGSAWEWQDVGGTQMLRIPTKNATLTLRLEDDERAALAEYVPGIGD